MSHPPIHGFFGPFRFLSNFVPVQVQLDGLMFSSTEHAYVAAKTIDLELRQIISEIQTPGEVKKVGRNLPLRPDWETVKFEVMEDLLIQKFSQEPFMTQLLGTGDAYLEETNHWGDVIWGVCNGIGENNLGKLLMKIRSNLRAL